VAACKPLSQQQSASLSLSPEHRQAETYGPMAVTYDLDMRACTRVQDNYRVNVNEIKQ